MNSVFVTTQEWSNNRDFHYHARQVVDSTNNWAKKDFSNLSEPTLFLADQQTAGRGRGENIWTSPSPGHGLLCTFAYPLEQPPQPICSPLFGLALFKSFRKSWSGLEWSLKPPNDLKLGQRKLAGLLIESIQEGRRICLVVGLGVNVMGRPEAMKPASFLNGDEGLGGSLTSEKWYEFLDHLSSNFSLASQASIKSKLDHLSRADLVEALNKDPNLAEPILDVSESGDIVFDEKIISWKEL